ncbi:hypothetical protein BDP27DRAFT_1363884 [Rhodocollybia butyracea]|uniref:Uncharacterized protein n=1 Tax=Rhodocollybia butyracea TaxID=206335 RepID=A0A9P5PMV0_9AGAR|nr:hypothetical protein BDP27DRAFT_1363884 [Rhodocollybia butyracea]
MPATPAMADGDPLVQELLTTARYQQNMAADTEEGGRPSQAKYSPYIWVKGLGRHIINNFLPWFDQEVPEERQHRTVWLVKFVDREQAKIFRTGYDRASNDGDTITTTRAVHSDYLAMVRRPDSLMGRWQNGEALDNVNHPPAPMRRMEIDFVEQIMTPLSSTPGPSIERTPHQNSTAHTGAGGSRT